MGCITNNMGGMVAGEYLINGDIMGISLGYNDVSNTMIFGLV